MVKRCGISFETLADFVDERADERAAAQVREHLEADCAHCRESVQWLQRAALTMSEAAKVQVPPGLASRLHALYTERFRLPVRKSFLARIIFDGRSTPLLAGARGAAEEAFKLNFSTDLHDIDVWEEPAGPGRWYVIGQVLPREGDEVIQPAQVVFTATDGAEISVTPDMPEFHLASVPNGTYQVSVRLDDGEILLPDFAVGR